MEKNHVWYYYLVRLVSLFMVLFGLVLCLQSAVEFASPSSLHLSVTEEELVYDVSVYSESAFEEAKEEYDLVQEEEKESARRLISKELLRNAAWIVVGTMSYFYHNKKLKELLKN